MTSYEKEYNEALASAVKLKKKWISEALAEEAKQYLADLDGGYIDHVAYREKAVSYWERFGYVPEEFWFELAGSRDGVMDPHFIPADLLYTELIPYLNNMQFAKAVDDKAYYDMWFPDAKQAVTVSRRIAGIWYDDKMNIISGSEAVKRCMDSAGELFVKPSLYTSGGCGIQTVDSSEIGADELAGILERSGANLVVQEKIKQHAALDALNPDAICVIRISTLLLDGDVHIAHELLRVAAPGEKLTLRGKGDYLAGILSDGKLHEKVMFFETAEDAAGNERYTVEWADAAAHGFYDSGFTVPSMSEVRECAKKLHKRLPHFRYIGWDFTVDKEGDPLMIEMNFSPGYVHGQVATCTPMFGDMTDRVLEDFFITRTLEKNQCQGLLVQ